MRQVVDKAAALWQFNPADVRLVATRENAVYEVRRGDERFALRLHRAGYRTDAELRSELMWMTAIGRGGLSVPVPVTSPDGDTLKVIDGVQVDVLTWLSGHTLDQALPTATTTQSVAWFHALGARMAHLHDLSDSWEPPAGFARCFWDRAGLVGSTPLWGRFWENPDLTHDDRVMFAAFRDRANVDLAGIAQTADYGLIHADLVPANVMVDGTEMHLIDFDDGGYGFRLFDIATALLKRRDDPDYTDLKKALIAGYLKHRKLDTTMLPLFMALRATSYVGWNIARLAEDPQRHRNLRFITTARELVTAYLQTNVM